MKKLLKILGYIFGGLVALIIVGLIVTFTVFPKKDVPPDIKVDMSPENIEKGRYLAENVAMCFWCHSEPNMRNFGGMPNPGTMGQGHNHSELLGSVGLEMPEGLILTVPNITPAALKDWTDGEIHRAITGGIGNDGKFLFPMMPYEKYRHMAEEDVQAIIAYLRSIAPIEKIQDPLEIPFPLPIIMRFMPSPHEGPEKRPDGSNSVALGKYLADMGNCVGCHTPSSGESLMDPPDKTREWAGGMKFPLLTGGHVVTANLTPHETGLGNWTKEAFIARFKAYATKEPEADSAATDTTQAAEGEEQMAEGKKEWVPTPVEEGAFNTIMPWPMYADLTEEDLGAIFDFLKTLPPMENQVVKFIP